MDTTVITSEPPATPTKTKKRKMSAAGRKAIAEAAKARWAAKKAMDATPSGNVPATPVPAVPVPPSPAVLKLQEQVVELVTARHQARSLLNEAHNAYLAAQSKFQAAESELKGIEQEVQYRISLIAQLENRPAVITNSSYVPQTQILQMPAVSGNITSEPAQQQQVARNLSQETFAVSSADDLRREVRGMM